MQNYKEIHSGITLTHSRAFLVENEKTIMSNNSGTAFPTSDLELGMNCYRSDQKKLYSLIDEENQEWKLAFDLTKTATNKEYVDAKLKTKAAVDHDHTAQFYSKADADNRYYTKVDSNKEFLSKNETATDSDKLGGVGANSYIRSDKDSSVTQNINIARGKFIGFGENSDFRAFADGDNAFLSGYKNGLGIHFNQKRLDGAVVSSLSMNGGSAPSVSLYHNGSVRLQSRNYGVEITGDLLSTGNVITNSDSRLKKDVRAIDSALERILRCRGVEFALKQNNAQSYGVIAQELEKEFPLAVISQESMSDDEEGMRGVAYQSMVGPIIEAIKDLSNKVDELDARITKSAN